VGERGQNKPISCGSSFDLALREYSKKFKEKSGLAWDDRNEPGKAGKYVFIERSYEPDTSSEDEDALPGAGPRRGSKQSVASSEGVKSELELPVQHLLSLIFNQQHFKEVMADMAYDLDKLPLGKLSKRTLEQGYQCLKDLAGLILNNEDADVTTGASNRQEMEELTNMYLSTIPHNFGRNRPRPIVSEEQLKKEIGLLESLSDMKIAEDIMKEAKSGPKSDVHPLDRQYAGLNMKEMTALDPKSTEFTELAAYLDKTRGHTHGFVYTIEDIFRIRREGEFDRFENSQYGKMAADRRLLWHGSRTTNFGGILSQGLRIAPPEAPVSGYMFG
jgi:poly [ADP-ribose] polymerase